MNKAALIIFAREPKLGKVKTRLAQDLGDEQTLSLYKAFIEDVCAMARAYQNADAFIFYQGRLAKDAYLRTKADDFVLRPQCAGDLGARMWHACVEVLDRGYEKVLLIGTDCLTITARDLDLAFQKLDSHQVVLGPADDGGYYLLGCKRAYKSLFSNIEWGTERVLAATVAQIRRRAWRYFLLKQKRDIDYLSDLRYLKAVDFEAVSVPHTRRVLNHLSVKL